MIGCRDSLGGSRGGACKAISAERDGENCQQEASRQYSTSLYMADFKRVVLCEASSDSLIGRCDWQPLTSGWICISSNPLSRFNITRRNG